jgi:hypothetical protein
VRAIIAPLLVGFVGGSFGLAALRTKDDVVAALLIAGIGAFGYFMGMWREAKR